MRAVLLALCLATIGCGAQPLASTLFFTRVTAEAPLDDGSWRALASASRAASCADVVTLAPLDADAWLVWCAGDADDDVLIRVRRTSYGLEAQSLGRHRGSRVRPTIRGIVIGSALVVVVESSSDAQSIERVAALYVERGPRIVPLTLDDAHAVIRVRAERVASLAGGWSRAETMTATLEAGTGGIVVHEHVSVREIAEGRPELPARATYEVERARFLRGRGDALDADRPSLFDDVS